MFGPLKKSLQTPSLMLSLVMRSLTSLTPFTNTVAYLTGFPFFSPLQSFIPILVENSLQKSFDPVTCLFHIFRGSSKTGNMKSKPIPRYLRLQPQVFQTVPLQYLKPKWTTCCFPN